MTIYNVPIGVLFEVLGVADSALNIVQTSDIPVEIMTPTGFANIEGFVRKQSPTARYTVGDHTITCADGHLVQSGGVTVRIENADMVDRVDGTQAKVTTRTSIGDTIVYDVCLPSPHLYSTPNGLIHHNTTLARVLANDLGVQEADFMYINASRDNGVDFIRDRVMRFSSTIPWGDFKIILMDEADYLSHSSQAALRGIMEEYVSVVRFVFTCNSVNKMIGAIKSRCQEFHISNHDHSDFTSRVAEILISENVEIDLETIDTYVRASYPDLRKTINSVQQNTTDGKLHPPSVDDASSSDWRLQMVSLFRDKNLKAARTLICKSATPDEFDEMFVFLYRNLDFFGDTDDRQDAAIVIIRDGMVKHTLIADPEINFSATMIELENIK
jgi:hypothetical protein